MRREIMSIKLITATIVFLFSLNLHAAIVYNISTSAGAAQISGTITTDGTIGRVGISSILEWNLFIDTPIVNFQLNNLNSVIWPSSVHGFDATSSELFFNHTEAWLNGSVDHLQFINPDSGNLWCLDNSLVYTCVSGPRASAVLIQEFYPVTTEFYESTNLGLEKVGTAAVVPIPAAVWLLGSGLLGLVGIARRKVHTS